MGFKSNSSWSVRSAARKKRAIEENIEKGEFDEALGTKPKIPNIPRKRFDLSGKRKDHSTYHTSLFH